MRGLVLWFLHVTPVHRLKTEYQYNIAIDAAQIIQRVGGVFLGSITDNQIINKNFCRLFYNFFLFCEVLV